MTLPKNDTVLHNTVGGGAYDAPQKCCRKRAVQGAGPYILNLKHLDKSQFIDLFQISKIYHKSS